ncbi:hypothetical protein SAMN05421553_4331 [Pseudomonas anguilliseptica]|uniref:Uncharacterized protein n=1 Tax=Pseudomonas anguilliseptica TaxID=53406 RepID=A0A1H5H6P3_PSEAG|nr:hypothetical protein SAMN05421553_4331 [Pseudomonas anguilliseptica]
MPTTRSHVRHAGLLSNLLALALLTLPLPTQAASIAADARPSESRCSVLTLIS